MRAVATLVILLLLLVPLGAAQDEDPPSGSGSSSNSSSGPNEGPSEDPDPSPSSGPGGPDGCPMPEESPDTPEEAQACQERFCRRNPDNERCKAEAGQGDEGQGDEADDGPREWRRWCRDEARDDVQRERCRQALAEYGSQREGRWISFQVDAANASLLDYRVDGLLVADSIHLETGSDNLTVTQSGSAIRIGDADTELVLHDDPTGLVRLKGDDGSLTINLPADADVQHSEDGSAARIAYPGGRVAHLRSDNATFLDDHTVLASGFLALLVPHAREDDRSGPQHDDAEKQDRDERVNDAIEDRKIGAEITLRSPSGPAAAVADGNGSVEVLAYDDVEVQVQMPSGDVATPDAPIRIELSAELEEGRTIVLNLNRSLLESADADSLVLRYFDLHEQADGSVVETEVVIRMAAGLQDILDASDDGGQPEYWVVEDANGLQALFTIPHWSAHAITVGSLAKITSPSVMAGLFVGVAASLVAAAVMFWPRKAEDE